MENKNFNTVSVTLKFSPQVAFRVYDEFTDSVTTDSENNLYVTTKLPDDEFVYNYLLTFGDTAAVLAPAHVRAAVKDKVCSILKMYET